MLNGHARMRVDGQVEITIDVETKDRLSVLGIDDVSISRDGESISEFDAKS